MTLTDTGPLVALLDKNDPNHARCFAAAKSLPKGPLLTTLCCVTEILYFLGKEGGHAAQQRLWAMRRAGRLVVHISSEAELDRMETLMQQYKDIPMDAADASLVAVAEQRNLSRIFTLDSHFRAYRLNDTGVFRVVP